MSRSRSVAFTDQQMFVAKATGKFPTHREFVAWLFLKQHKCKIEDHLQLKYEHMEKSGVYVTQVSGELGKALRVK